MNNDQLINRRRITYGDLGKRRPIISGQNPRKKPKSKKKWLKPLIYTVVALSILGFISSTVVIAVISRDLPDPEKLSERQIAQSTKIYDRTGEHLLYEVYQDQKRTMVDLDKISPFAVKATVAVEDKNFYTHKGIRFISIIRAGFNNLIGRKTGSGGASTLTQQLIKISIVGGERSYFRKIKEALLAMRLEKKYTKDQILKMYLNEAPYGSTNYGIEAASQSYFKKSAIDLNLQEAATLAALLKQPTRYLNNTEMLKERRNVVLRLMFEQEYITEEEKNEAQEAELKIIRNTGIMDAPHFVMHIKQLLAEKYGEKMVDQSGLKVITTLDFEKQKIAENIIQELGDKFATEANANNAALVAISPKNSEVLAMVGSRDFRNEEIDGQFNVATLGKRQPGSSFKPFVYAAAFEKGFTPETVLYDVVTNFESRSGGDYSPKNYDNKERGLVTMRKALQGSLNIPAVKALYLVGEKNMADFAERFGYTTLSAGQAGLSLVLGGAEVNLLEHTNAYATLANNGQYKASVFILQIFDDKGNEIYAFKEVQGSEALKPEISALITSVLTDDAARAFTFGLNSTLTLPDRPVAAKTGTTNDYKDAWTMGYVPSLAVGVWVGNTIPSPMKGGGNKLAGQIWNKFMREALASTSPEQFPAPPENDAEKAILRGSDGSIKIQVNRLNGRIATSSTPEDLVVEREFLPPHSILHYINKNDPRGLPPENPFEDPQYEAWETAIANWAEREKNAGRDISFSEPPTELDMFSSDPALMPTIVFLSPYENETINSRQFEINVEASAPRGVYEVVYKINGNVIGINRQSPFSLSYYLKDLPKGLHTLTVTASDDIGNMAMNEIKFNLQADIDPPGFNWMESSPLHLNENDFPRSISVIPFRWSEIKKIEVRLIGEGQNKLIYTFDHNDKLLTDKLNFTWNSSPGKGNFILTGIMTNIQGDTATKDLQIIVE
jgi:1A family penicillin-binding protein